MTPEQYMRYTAALITGYTSGVDGIRTWTLYRPDSSDNISARATFTSQGTRTLYILEEDLSRYGQPQPPQPVGVIPYRMVAPVGTDVQVGDVVVSGSFIFEVKTLDSDQGFPTGKAEKTGMPALASSGQAGYRSPLWILGLSA